MITASSTSQSSCWVILALCSIASPGPITEVGGLEKITGCFGKSLLVSKALALSATCSR
ncbi:MAG: hypothetical protein ACD_10C00840G0003 [uncultured bacterium]|nr:MAG: hypothetical protein ACD_10C00840G0003 [uncultured bacterium]